MRLTESLFGGKGAGMIQYNGKRERLRGNPIGRIIRRTLALIAVIFAFWLAGRIVGTVAGLKEPDKARRDMPLTESRRPVAETPPPSGFHECIAMEDSFVAYFPGKPESTTIFGKKLYTAMIEGEAAYNVFVEPVPSSLRGKANVMPFLHEIIKGRTLLGQRLVASTEREFHSYQAMEYELTEEVDGKICFFKGLLFVKENALYCIAVVCSQRAKDTAYPKHAQMVESFRLLNNADNVTKAPRSSPFHEYRALADGFIAHFPRRPELRYNYMGCKLYSASIELKEVYVVEVQPVPEHFTKGADALAFPRSMLKAMAAGGKQMTSGTTGLHGRRAIVFEQPDYGKPGASRKGVLLVNNNLMYSIMVVCHSQSRRSGAYTKYAKMLESFRLVDVPADPSVNSRTFFFDCVARNNCVSARAMVKDQPDWVDLKDESGCTPLHYAAANGQMAMAELLIKSGANVNAANDDGLISDNTPLHVAIETGNVKLT